MAELWPYVELDIAAEVVQPSHSLKKQPMIDILTWLQCSTYIRTYISGVLPKYVLSTLKLCLG